MKLNLGISPKERLRKEAGELIRRRLNGRKPYLLNISPLVSDMFSRLYMISYEYDERRVIELYNQYEEIEDVVKLPPGSEPGDMAILVDLIEDNIMGKLGNEFEDTFGTRNVEIIYVDIMNIGSVDDVEVEIIVAMVE